MKKLTYISLCVFVIFFSGCSVINSDDDSQATEFLNTRWTLKLLAIDEEMIAPPQDQLYTIQFASDSTFTGQSDCNEIGRK